jgi:hypothetical protein
LRHAERHFGAAEIDGKECSANRIAKAAEILEESAANVSGQCQAALLHIAGAMASNSLSKIEDCDSILTWDESLHLLPMTEKGEIAVNIKINDLHESYVKPIAKTDLPVLEISKERYEAKDQILADGWLVPIKVDMACRSYGQLLLPSIEQQFNEKLEMTLKPENGRQESHERALTDANEERYEQTNEEINEVRNNEPIRFSEVAPDPEIEKESQESPFIHSKAVFLLKVMTALLLMLLAIEAILYLI